MLGISTYENMKEFQCNNDDIENLSYYDKIKFIDDNSKTWEHKSVWDDAIEYFDLEKTYCVNYDGFLINHTKKQAINLKEYFENSKFFVQDIEATIDLISVLTETGGGTAMVLMEGITSGSTEHLVEDWCGDLLQIVEECPKDYELLEFCISQSSDRMRYCYKKYDTNKDGYLFKNENGDLFRAFSFSPFHENGRSVEQYIKVTEVENGIQFSGVKVDEKDTL